MRPEAMEHYSDTVAKVVELQKGAWTYQSLFDAVRQDLFVLSSKLGKNPSQIFAEVLDDAAAQRM